MPAYIATRKEIVERFHAVICEKGGAVNLFFDDRAQAHDCAEELESLIPSKVLLSGCQVTVDVSGFLMDS